MPINTIDELHEHLELAIHIELATIPPYLYAMYSIEDQSSDAALLLKSIVAEEMLHAVLVANLLLATGGSLKFNDGSWAPKFPMPLPHHEPPLQLDLAPLSVSTLTDTFMRIEQPEEHDAPMQPDRFETLGQFYHALENGLHQLSAGGGLFDRPQVERQMSDPGFYAPVEYDSADSGGLIAVTDLASALEAIEIIVHQGEGLATSRWADPSHHELTHYFKLIEIVERWDEVGPIRPTPKNPRSSDFPGEIRRVSDLFNASYRYLFVLMDRIFSGTRPQPPVVADLYVMMKTVLGGLARYLVAFPLPEGRCAAPTFEVFEFETERPDQELAALAAEVVGDHPDLAHLVDILDRWVEAEQEEQSSKR